MNETAVKEATDNLLRMLNDPMLTADSALKYSQALTNLANAAIGFRSTDLLKQ